MVLARMVSIEAGLQSSAAVDLNLNCQRIGTACPAAADPLLFGDCSHYVDATGARVGASGSTAVDTVQGRSGGGRSSGESRICERFSWQHGPQGRRQGRVRPVTRERSRADSTHTHRHRTSRTSTTQANGLRWQLYKVFSLVLHLRFAKPAKPPRLAEQLRRKRGD
jgi:hypothetical protein